MTTIGVRMPPCGASCPFQSTWRIRSSRIMPPVQSLWRRVKWMSASSSTPMFRICGSSIHCPSPPTLPDAPYGIGASLPTAYYNMASYGLDQVAVRKAIAMAVDYDTIIANAMTNQSPTFAQVPRSLMNPTPGEQALYDSSDPPSRLCSGLARTSKAPRNCWMMPELQSVPMAAANTMVRPYTM